MQQLTQAVENQARNKAGTRVLRRIVHDRPSAPATESHLETKLVQWLRSEGLPDPERQVNLYDETGFVARVDLAYTKQRIAIEADSYRYHSGREAWERDLLRRNRLTAIGYTVFHVTAKQIRERDSAVIHDLRAKFQLWS